jgi:GNAT superfamily N-acetyltransferase
MAKDPWSVVSQENTQAPDGWSVVSADPIQPARRAVNVGAEPPPAGLSGEFAGFADVFAPPAAAEPVVAAPQPTQPKPYRNRQEALNDAVNMLEEGFDQNQVIQSFKNIGVNWNEIIKRGKERSSPYFREQYVTPEEAARARAMPRTDTATITGREPGVLEGTANLFKRANTRFGDMATGFLFSTGAFDADQAAFRLRETARQRAAAAPSTAIQQGMEAIGNATTYGEAAEAMLRNPRATFTMLAESLLVTAPTLAATIATAPAGAAVRAGMTFAGSGAMEYTSVMADVLQDKGIDLMDPARVARALQDPKVLDEIKEKGAKRGLIVGAFDALSMGLAGRFMQPANDLIAAGKLTGSAAKKATVAAWGKELALQMGAGAGGEFAAQKATGEDRPADVLMEGLAEGLTSPIDVYSSLRDAQRAETLARVGRVPSIAPPAPPAVPAVPPVAPAARVEPRLETGELPAPAGERREPTFTFRPLQETEEDVVPGMPTGAELEEEPATAPPAAPPAVEPTIAAAALPETPTVPPETKPKTFEPTPPQHMDLGRPIVGVPVKDLKLSDDVPQFKYGANKKGVVEPLGGKFTTEGVAPIAVWQRLDGSLEVISGRHRFDLAQRSGTEKIPAQIYYESQGFTAMDAAIKDAELNIRDDQGKVKDYVNYFRESGTDRQTAESKGFLARDKGKRGFTIANQGSDELIDSLRADQVGDEAAFYIALNAPNDARLQGVGIKAVMDGKSANTAIHMMQAVKALASERDTTTDMFGFDDSAIREAEEMAKIAARKQREIDRRLSVISGTVKDPAIAKAEGIDVRDPEAVKRRIEELRQKKAAWKNWSTSPDLVAEIRAERGTAPPTLTPVEPVIAAQTEEELRQKAEQEAAAAKREADERRKAEEKAKADEERDEFVLTGSDRAADEAAARGQQDIFGAAEEAPEVTRNPIEALEGMGFVRLAQDDPRRYTDKGGNQYLTLQRGPVRVALSPKEALFVSSRMAVMRAMDEGYYTLSAILVDSQARGQGLARKAINDVIKAADQFGVGLFVEPAPLDDKPMSRDQLVKFYESLGFESAPDADNKVMMRKAAAPAEAPAILPAKKKPKEPQEEKPSSKDVVDKYLRKVRAEKTTEAYEDYEGKNIRTVTSEWKGTISREDFDALAGESEVTQLKRGNKYTISLEDTPTTSSTLAFTARGLTPTQQRVEVVMQLQTSTVVEPEAVEPGSVPDENDPGFLGASDEEVKEVAGAFKGAKKTQAADDNTRVFDAPAKQDIVRIEDKARKSEVLTIAEAKKRIEEWKRNAQAQGETSANSDKVVLSLFDATGEWSKPWEEAGYQVFRFDIQTDPEMGDVTKFSAEFFNDLYGAFDGQDVYAVLAACPCTDFASSGARHFAAKDESGKTVESVELVHQTLRTIEYFKPSIWAIENPVGRIEKLTGLPPWRMSFNPNHFGDPYTKKTLLWGRFNADLPVAPVVPTEGSKMHRMYGGNSQETKNARSVTPEGFAYAFFQANNVVDNPVMAVSNKYDMMDPAVIKQAVDAGMTEQEISSAVDDAYYDQDYAQANSDLKKAIAAKKPKGAAVMGERMVNAADRFRKAAMNQFKLTQEQADAAMGKLLKEKVLTLDPVTGQFELKDGRFWDRDVLLKAAGEKPAEEKKPEVSKQEKENKENAEVHAKELGGEIVWQKGEYALIRGYSAATGDPVYAGTMGSRRASVDIEAFTGNQIPEDIKQEMIAAKKKAEAEAQEAHEKKPFIKFKDGLAISESISPELEGVIRGWKDVLKLDVPIYVGTIEDARRNKNKYTGPHRRIGSGTLDTNERGSMRRMSDGSYYILFAQSTSPTLMLETIAHEMGHLHERLVYEKASPEEKRALADAHAKWLEKQKGKSAQDLVNALRGRATQRQARMPKDLTAEQLNYYWKSFGEWYADQVSRWAVSGTVPVGVVEKFFKRLGNQLRRFFQVLKNAKYLPDETFVQYIEKATARPVNLAPDNQDISDRMVEGDLPADKVDVLQNIEPKNKAEQVGFTFDTKAADEVSRNNPTVAKTLAKANELPGAKKKLPPGRSPELAAAAEQVQAGLMTAKEFDELVNRYKPIPVYFAPLKPATSDQVYNALDSAKREKIDPNISTGYPVGLRLDIPAFNRHGVFVVSIHEKRTPSSPGKVIGYSSVASIKDVTFGVGNQKEALRIATGEAKDAIQTMEGKYNPITPEQAYQIADDAILSGDWVQVGFDPTRHAYFFDRRTTVPVVAADEVIQIGNMILARGVTYGKKDDFLYNIGSDKKQEADFGAESLREYQIERYASLRRKIATTLRKVAKGQINIDMQRNLTRMLQESRELQASIKSSAPRRDSAERFMAKALEEYDKGNIDAEVLAVIEQVYQKFPDLLEGLLLSVRKGDGKTAGSFASLGRIVSLFKGTSGTYNPVTVRHELSHSLEQMMTPEQAAVVIQAWTKALARAIKQNPDDLHQKYFNAVLDFIENPTNATLKAAQDALPSYEMYQFINPSEYWAVNAEKLLGAELGPAWDRFKKAVRKLFEALKNIFGFDNTYAIHKVFDQVMGGKRERITKDALANMVAGVGGEFTTLRNIEDEKELLEKYSRPKTPMLDKSPLKTFITRQFKNGKEFFVDAAQNPKEAMVGSSNSVVDGLIYLRNENVWYGSGLEARDFDRYNGELRTSEGMATASVALDNAIRSGNIGVQVIFQGGIKYDKDKNNFVAVDKNLGMKGVYEAEAKIKERLGEQLGTDIVQGYLEAKRSISIMDELYDREAALEDAKQNLEAMRALKRPAEEIAQAEAAVNDAKSDLDAINKAVSSVNMSEEEMNEFAALDQKHPELRELMDNWTAINQNLLKFWRQVGLLSQGRYERLSSIKDYVPWYRIMNDEEDVHSPLQSTTRTLANIGREKLFKRGKPVSVVDFRAKEGQQDFKIQPSSVVKVKVNGQRISSDKISVTSSGEVRIDMPLQENDLVVFETNREIENIIDNMTRNVMRMTMNGIRQFAANRIVLEYASRNENGKIMVFPNVDKNKGRFNWIVNGKKVVVEIQDPLVAASIYGMENLNLQMWAPLAAVANFTRRTITLSGVFQVKQVFKDAPTAALVTGVKNPLALIGGVWKGFLTSLTMTDPVVDILKAAGIGGYMSPARTPEAEIKRRLGIMNRNVFDFVIKGLDHIGDAADMAQRVAVYKRVMAETGDETQALYQAANVINFLHHGSAGYAQAIVKTVPFFGAYANATDVLVRALLGGGLKGMKRRKALMRLGITVTMLTSLTILYSMLAGGDPEYDELDDQTKLRNIIIPGTKIMLPMNTSAAFIFKALPELIYNRVTREGTNNEYDRKRLQKALAEVAKDTLLGPEPIPAGIKPILEIAINRNFFTGRPIIPEGIKDLEAAEQYTAATSELGKKISAMLAVPGTDGKRALSPVEVDHLIRGIFGTAGAMGQWVSNSIGAMSEVRPEPSARETPITGSFLREEVPRGREDLFYDFRDRVNEKYKTYMKMMDREDFEAADKYIEKHGDVADMYQYVNEIENTLKGINAEIRLVGETKSKEMTPQQRRKEIQDLQREKLEILDDVKDARREAFGTGFGILSK